MRTMGQNGQHFMELCKASRCSDTVAFKLLEEHVKKAGPSLLSPSELSKVICTVTEETMADVENKFHLIKSMDSFMRDSESLITTKQSNGSDSDNELPLTKQYQKCEDTEQQDYLLGKLATGSNINDLDDIRQCEPMQDDFDENKPMQDYLDNMRQCEPMEIDLDGIRQLRPTQNNFDDLRQHRPTEGDLEDMRLDKSTQKLLGEIIWYNPTQDNIDTRRQYKSIQDGLDEIEWCSDISSFPESDTDSESLFGAPTGVQVVEKEQQPRRNICSENAWQWEHRLLPQTEWADKRFLDTTLSLNHLPLTPEYQLEYSSSSDSLLWTPGGDYEGNTYLTLSDVSTVIDYDQADKLDLIKQEIEYGDDETGKTQELEPDQEQVVADKVVMYGEYGNIRRYSHVKREEVCFEIKQGIHDDCRVRINTSYTKKEDSTKVKPLRDDGTKETCKPLQDNSLETYEATTGESTEAYESSEVSTESYKPSEEDDSTESFITLEDEDLTEFDLSSDFEDEDFAEVCKPSQDNDSTGVCTSSQTEDDGKDQEEVFQTKKYMKKLKVLHQEEDTEEVTESSQKDEVDRLGQVMGSKKQRLKLETLLKAINAKIRTLESRELSLDDLDDEDAVNEIEQYRHQFVKAWKLYCVITGIVPTAGRPVDQKYKFKGTKYPKLNVKIQNFVNSQKETPDFQDVYDIVRQCNKKYNLQLRAGAVHDMALNAFTRLLGDLQKRRVQDLHQNLDSHLEEGISPESNPVHHDTELQEKLERNQKTYKRRMTKVLDEYARKQEEGCDWEEDESDEADGEEDVTGQRLTENEDNGN